MESSLEVMTGKLPYRSYREYITETNGANSSFAVTSETSPDRFSNSLNRSGSHPSKTLNT